jgi:hypothetical protein
MEQQAMTPLRSRRRRILIQFWAMSLLPAALLSVPSTLPARDENRVAPKTPATILIIRHAEKPAEEGTSDGLTPKGEERAKALYQLFEKSATRPTPFPKPDFIFAAKATKSSRRSKLTVAPLAEKLLLPVNDGFGKDEFERLHKELATNPKYAGKTILICWQHGSIPQLAKALGAMDVQAEWPAHTFDHVWELDYGRDGKVKFANMPQRLLNGDLTGK